MSEVVVSVYENRGCLPTTSVVDGFLVGFRNSTEPLTKTKKPNDNRLLSIVIVKILSLFLSIKNLPSSTCASLSRKAVRA